LRPIRHLILSSILLFVTASFSQMSTSLLSEYQLGNLPDTEPKNLSTLYNQFTLSYRQQASTIGVRYESFQASADGRSFEHFAQRYFEWQKGAFRGRLGNYYTTLGRGLLLRAFELPNVIFEQRQFRRRYGYYRDMDGLLFEGTWSKFEFKLLYGRPLNNAFPPELENFDRRDALVQGGQISFRPLGWLTIGDAYARTHFRDLTHQEMNSIFTTVSLAKILRKAGLKRASLKLYAEHARANFGATDFFSTSPKDPHATFMSLSFSYKKIGLTAEYKDYQQFENNINLPPLGYMEHGYYLLNRSTHELLSDNEKGYQVELNFRPTDKLFLLANTSLAKNEFDFATFEFAEQFAEATVYWSDNVTAKTFYDQAKDEIKGEHSRKIGGIDLEWSFSQNYAITIELQHQAIDRRFGRDYQEKVKNTYTSFTLSRAPQLSLSVVLSRSTDPAETDDPNTLFEIENEPKYWLSFVAGYQVNMSHELSVFVGSRRGGLVCLSGTCYEVLPFKGIEIRWIAHF